MIWITLWWNVKDSHLEVLGVTLVASSLVVRFTCNTSYMHVRTLHIYVCPGIIYYGVRIHQLHSVISFIHKEKYMALFQGWIFYYTGSPSPPTDVSLTTAQGNTPIVTVTIQWNSPTNTGNGLPIQIYILTLPDIDYSEPVDCSNSSCSHTFPVNGSGDNVMYNTPYPVNVTANNACGMESSPATGTGTLQIVAHG